MIKTGEPAAPLVEITQDRETKSSNEMDNEMDNEMGINTVERGNRQSPSTCGGLASREERNQNDGKIDMAGSRALPVNKPERVRIEKFQPSFRSRMMLSHLNRDLDIVGTRGKGRRRTEQETPKLLKAPNYRAHFEHNNRPLAPTAFGEFRRPWDGMGQTYSSSCMVTWKNNVHIASDSFCGEAE